MAPRYHTRMPFTLRAITLDLDETLWPFAPVGARIERSLHAWMLEHSPRTARRFPIAQMRALRERVGADNPQLAHDLNALRRLTIERALTDSGGDLALAEAAYAIFYAERNRVEFYPDVPNALARLAARLPLAAVTNGNADLGAIGIADSFRFQLGAREHGAGKPDASIFHAACARLGCVPSEVLHAGDDVELDVVGAARAGLRTAWINRIGLVWPHAEVVRPDLELTNLGALADWLDSNAQPTQERMSA